MPSSSKIFTGYRALGMYSNHVPLAVRHHRKHKENYVVTCVGKAFHTYNCSRLGIVSVSNSHPGDISCLAVDATLVYTACGPVIRAFTRGRQVCHTYEGHEADVHLLLPFGGHLISVDATGCLKIWDIASEDLYLEIQFDPTSFLVTAMMHPTTYLNKVLLASHQGALQLWNIRTNRRLFEFRGWSEPVTALEQAPAVDVVAIGLQDGRVILHNLKYDETVMTFTQDWGPVTNITFRTDGHPIMATGSSIGHIALWNLEERRLQSEIRDAHQGAVSGMKCLPSEPLLVTSSADNSVKVWIFDQPDGGGRLLRHRSGHSAPPCKVRFHGNNGQNILSAGQDSTLRSLSTVHDRHNKSLGRASFNKTETRRLGLKRDKHMMPPITNFVSEMSRQSDWDGIAACHHGLDSVTTWNYQRSSMGQHRLLHDRFKAMTNVEAQCVVITSCGNFVIIGYNTGHMDCYNIQSGIHRGAYGNPKAHDSCVRDVVVDGLNQLTVSLGGDGQLKFWKFKSKQLLDAVKLGCPAEHMCLHRDSCMLAVALSNYTISVVDIETRNIIRKFSGHSNRVTDLAFSPNSHWLVSSCMNCTVRVWDLPSGALVDCFLTDVPVTSLAMSPTSEFLVTCHVDDLSVYLWSNKTLYSHVPLAALPADFEPQVLELPSTSSQAEDDKQFEPDTTHVEVLVDEYKSPDQLASELVTLSLLPSSRWLSLLSLDLIKLKNKPKEPPKVPKLAPFFLPTIPGLQPKFAPIEDNKEKQDSHVLKTNLSQPLSELGRLLQQDPTDGVLLNFIKDLGPSRLDAEIRMLGPEGGGSVQLLVNFLQFVRHQLTRKTNFEFIQAVLGLFIKVFGDLISQEAVLLEEARKLVPHQSCAWDHLQTMFNKNLCLVNYLKSATL